MLVFNCNNIDGLLLTLPNGKPVTIMLVRTEDSGEIRKIQFEGPRDVKVRRIGTIPGQNTPEDADTVPINPKERRA